MTSKYIKDCGVYIERDYSIIIYINPYIDEKKSTIIRDDITDVIGEGIRLYETKTSGICPFNNEIKISLTKYMDITPLFWDIYSKLRKDKRISVVTTSMKKPTADRSKKTTERK